MTRVRRAPTSQVPDDIAAAARAITTIFHPHVEVALHDVERDRLVAIWNPFSTRSPGDESLLDPELLADVAAGRVLGPYEQVDRHGRRQSSVSVLVNAGRMLLCINFDRTLVDSAAVSLAAFAAPREEQPAALFHRDWRAHVNRLIDDWCLEHGVSRSGINRSQRLALIADLDGRGVFDTRNAAAHVASALDVSRATVYALRKEHSGSRTTGQQT